MSGSLLEEYAGELRRRVAALASGLADGRPRGALRAEAHKLRGSALVLGLDGLAVASAAYEAALTDETDVDEARRAAALARAELDRALEPDPLRALRHELRNDLAVVLMAGKLLEAELAEPGLRDLATGVADAAERMSARLGELREPAPAEARPAPSASAAALSVLVVDDDELVAGVLERLLVGAGAQVDVAAGLAEAREALAAREYAAAIVDLNLDGGDGAELVPELRRRGTRVVVLSGGGEQAVEGAHVSLAKPVAAGALIAAVTGTHPIRPEAASAATLHEGRAPGDSQGSTTAA